jgi:citrate synthase
MPAKEHLTAAEAARELGVSVPTLYAYVSRGLIRSEPGAGASRARRYRGEDIELLKSRKQARHNPLDAAERNLSWGLPVLESALTLISDGNLYYRGLSAIELAASRTVEDVASLMWEGEFRPDYAELFAKAAFEVKNSSAGRLKLPDLAPLERFRAILPVAECEDLTAYDFSHQSLVRTGMRILALLTRTAAGGRWRDGVAQSLASAWAPNDNGAASVISMALILLIDHELAVSSFTARCAASAASPLYAVVEAGLCALRGLKHGGATERTDDFLREAAAAPNLGDFIARRMRRGEPMPGFGHNLYPAGDPRARLILETLGRRYPDCAQVTLARAIVKQASRISDQMLPNIDFAGAMLARTLALPPHSAVAIFALGRTIGWIGHAIEQYRIDRLIRPRARYVGAPPRKPNAPESAAKAADFAEPPPRG